MTHRRRLHRIARAPRCRPRRLVAPTVGLAVYAFVVGCGAPCDLDSDCPATEHCGEEQLCTHECAGDNDCAPESQCTDRGRCIRGLRPELTWIAPVDGSELAEAFDVELEVTFVGERVTVALDRSEDAPGEACLPFLPREVQLVGDANDETTQRVVFGNIAPFGARFGLRAVAARSPQYPRVAAATFRATEVPPVLTGVEVLEPAAAVLDGTSPLALLDVSLQTGVAQMWAQVRPVDAVPSALRMVGEQTDRVSAQLLATRGPQVLELEAVQSGEVRRCGIALDTAPNPFGGLEAALGYEGAEAGDLDLLVYLDPESGAPDTCSVDDLGTFCESGRGTPLVTTAGAEVINFLVEDGVYGLAVAPRAVGAPMRAELRLSRGDAHLAFIGPRSLSPDAGEVWLAARAYVVGGEVTLETLDRVQTGLPDEGPLGW